MITSGNEKIFDTPTSLARVALSCLPGTGLMMAWVNGLITARAIDKIRRSNWEWNSQVHAINAQILELSKQSNLLNVNKSISQIVQIGRAIAHQSEENPIQNQEIIVVGAKEGVENTALAKKKLQILIEALQHNNVCLEKEKIKVRLYLKWQGISSLLTLAMTIGAFSQDLLSKKYTASICISCLIILGMDGYILYKTNTKSANTSKLTN